MANEDHLEGGGSYGIPYYNKARRFEVWDRNELYTGPTGSGQHFPNDRDLAIDYDNGVMWQVYDADYTNWTYKLKPFNVVQVDGENGVIGGCAPHETDTFRVYVDPSKHPQVLRIDGRVWFNGPDLTHVRLFRGIDIGKNGEVISGYYNNGRLESDKIPLTLVTAEGNVSRKAALPGIATKSVENGEGVTLVVYSSNGEVAAIARFVVVLTNMVLAVESPARQILDVKLISPFISQDDDRLLLLPINIPLDDIPLEAEVRYNDGVRRVALDGTRAILHGLRNSGAHDTFYISSNAGQTLPLMLSYRMSANETYLGDDLVDGFINKKYAASTLEVNGAYSVKLFVVPRWLDIERGYRLNYYLYSLERGNVFDATPYVKPGVNSAVFDPTLYGVKQRLVVTCELSKVSPLFNPHIHPQSFHISLLSPGYQNGENFLIDYVQDQPNYGDEVFALFHYDNVTHWMLDVRCGAVDKVEWLQRLYYQSYPLYDRRTEAKPPEPTHFEVITKTKSYLMPIDAWVEPFHVDFQVDEADVIVLRWIRRTPNDDLQLGLSPMLAHQKP